MLIEQVIYLKEEKIENLKIRTDLPDLVMDSTENLKFRTDLLDLVMDGWSVYSRWLFTVQLYTGRLLKKKKSKVSWICQRWSLSGF